MRTHISQISKIKQSELLLHNKFGNKIAGIKDNLIIVEIHILKYSYKSMITF